MKNKSLVKSGILGLSILLGFTLLGYFIFKGFKTFSDKDRVVTVKGLAEMDIKATSSTISLDFMFSGDDLAKIKDESENKKNTIIKYLTTNGFKKNDITINKLSVIDRQTYYESQWIDGKKIEVKIDRYIVSQALTIQSNDVEKTEDKSSQISLDLITQDLTCNVSTNYSFPDLNSIKPQLIAESTKNARIAGEQFANDSKAKLGKIKTASQGQISLAGQYYDEEITQQPMEPYIQRARVVSTIVFFLE